MKLITKELQRVTPAIGSQQNVINPIAYIKLFTPWSSWTWYIMEANFETGEAYGLVDGFEAELGYFDLNELSEITGPGGLKIERDRWFQPTSLSRLKEQIEPRR